VTLQQATDIVGRRMIGPAWHPIADPGEYAAHVDDAAVERVITAIAERCEAGEISAAYRTIMGADELDRAVWRRPSWRNYFATGEVVLELPLLDQQGRPNTNGFTAKCSREIFVRRSDVEAFAAGLSKDTNTRPIARGAGRRKIASIVARYAASLTDGARPSIPDLERFAQQDGLTGHRDKLRAAYREKFPGQRVGRPAGR
jgi:hypothetical protein